jgi:hypothetical protein
MASSNDEGYLYNLLSGIIILVAQDEMF